jgi:hypothetical protein
MSTLKSFQLPLSSADALTADWCLERDAVSD